VSVLIERVVRCGKRLGGSYFCRCAYPATRCQEVKVIPADSPNVLSEEEARLLASWLRERPCEGNETQPIQEELEARFRNFAEGSTDA
jgi:hypothetical protein